MTKLIPYFEKTGDYGRCDYYPLKQTGRWKYVTNEYFIDKIFVEHKELIFGSWIDEDDIHLMPVRSEEIHDCGEKK